MEYQNLPKHLQEQLFRCHTHGGLVEKDEIVYREKDILQIISQLLPVTEADPAAYLRKIMD